MIEGEHGRALDGDTGVVVVPERWKARPSASMRVPVMASCVTRAKASACSLCASIASTPEAKRAPTSGRCSPKSATAAGGIRTLCLSEAKGDRQPGRDRCVFPRRR
jgi:hypothetical protein